MTLTAAPDYSPDVESDCVPVGAHGRVESPRQAREISKRGAGESGAGDCREKLAVVEAR